ncbi:hypothetical protein SDJN02_10561, partial [Cucurbita argyrosperma subsp. argyrosperma]
MMNAAIEQDLPKDRERLLIAELSDLLVSKQEDNYVHVDDYCVLRCSSSIIVTSLRLRPYLTLTPQLQIQSEEEKVKSIPPN